VLAFAHHLAGAAFTAAALGGDAQLQLDVAEIRTRLDPAGDVTVGDLVADADDHEGRGTVD